MADLDNNLNSEDLVDYDASGQEINHAKGGRKRKADGKPAPADDDSDDGDEDMYDEDLFSREAVDYKLEELFERFDKNIYNGKRYVMFILQKALEEEHPKPIKPFYCSLCNFVEFDTAAQLHAHNATPNHRNGLSRQKFIYCDMCKVNCGSSDGLNQHLETLEHSRLKAMRKYIKRQIKGHLEEPLDMDKVTYAGDGWRDHFVGDRCKICNNTYRGTAEEHHKRKVHQDQLWNVYITQVKTKWMPNRWCDVCEEGVFTPKGHQDTLEHLQKSTELWRKLGCMTQYISSFAKRYLINTSNMIRLREQKLAAERYSGQS